MSAAGLIHPPVGLNLFVIKNIAPDIPFRDVLWGALPLVAIMIVAVVLICIFPGVAIWAAEDFDGIGADILKPKGSNS
jgi:TRAP-type C4-dicarboxylate transport system permease large subunit